MNGLRALRKRVLTPNESETRLDVRGFHVKDGPSRDRLETVGRSFLAGYGHAAEAPEPSAAEVPLEQVPREFRGFAYEGAAMGFAVRDALPFGRHDHVARFLAGRGDDHIYMAYIGVGWAMARVPTFTRPRLYAPDPLLRWLVLDGYGFHQAYFRTQRYVHEQFQDPAFPWPVGGPSAYANRVIDQGIGRALWFVGGTDARYVADLIDTFAPERQADLYSGAGLAATYAGGAAEDELLAFWDRAGRCRPQVAQGSAFAAGARVRAGLVLPQTDDVTRLFCGMTAEDAAKVNDDALPDPAATFELPSYEVWRRNIADVFVAQGRC